MSSFGALRVMFPVIKLHFLFCAGTDILWSSSDSEDDTVYEVHLSKQKKTAKRPSPSKRKPIQVQPYTLFQSI